MSWIAWMILNGIGLYIGVVDEKAENVEHLESAW